MKNKLSINELCYSTLSSDKPNSFDTYVSQGGYETWKKIIKEMTNTNFHIPPEYVFFDICIDDKELTHKEYLKNYDNDEIN